MPVQRAILVLGSAAMATVATPAAAQVPDNVVLNIMRECAKIDDPTARLACYDNNIRAAGGNPRSVPGQGPVVRGGGAPGAANPGGPEGFGSESVRGPERFESYEQRGLGPDEIRARISDVRQLEPGMYRITIEGGAVWETTQSIGRSVNPPKRGDTIEIQRAALGSFLMVIEDQQGIRVRRVR